MHGSIMVVYSYIILFCWCHHQRDW